MSNALPIIDLAQKNGDRSTIVEQLHLACTESGFFYIKNHGVSEILQESLERCSHQFFALPLHSKMQIRMALGGKAWRGYFPVGDELTSGKPDLKEGLYFGAELSAQDPRVKAGWPMHGTNLFPSELPGFKDIVLEYMAALTQLGHQLVELLALSLGLEDTYFYNRYTRDPLTLFRIFHYPAPEAHPIEKADWGVGEHTDYGVLTILKQDLTGGLQVKSKDKWISAPPLPGTFICNIGDMLDKMTGGYYRSTPHRVLNNSGKSRFSYPFFFDPNFEARIQAIDLPPHYSIADAGERWDKQNVHQFEGTYRDYILSKVGKVFPDLHRDKL